MLRVDAQGLFPARHRLRVPAHLRQVLAEHVERIAVIRLKLDHLFQEFGGVPRVAGLLVDHRQQV